MGEILEVTRSEWPQKEPYSLVKLRELIASLDGSEKNVFKRHIRGYRTDNHKSNYIQLFDCVNDCQVALQRTKRLSASTGKEVKQRNQFYGKFRKLYLSRKIGKPGELGPMANYLYERILDALRYQNTADNQRLELYARMVDIHLLIRKGLQQESFSMIRYVKKIAMELEALPQLLELAQIEFRLAFMAKKKPAASVLRTLKEAEEKWLHQLKTTVQLKDLRGELLLVLLGQSNLEENPELLKKLYFFIDHFDQSLPRETFEEEHNYQTIMAYLIMINQKNSSEVLGQFLKDHPSDSLVDHYKAIVDLYIRYPERKNADQVQYRVTLFNFLAVALSKKSGLRIEEYQAELDLIQPQEPDFLYNVVYIRLVDFVIRQDFTAAKKFLHEQNVRELTEAPNNHAPLSRLQVIRYLAGLVCLVREEYREAVQWFTAHLEKAEQPSNSEALGASALYHLLARLELGFNSTRKIHRELLKPLHEFLPSNAQFAQQVIGTMDQILRAGKNPALVRTIAESSLPDLQEKMKALADSSHYGLFMGWLESKRQQLPLAQTIGPYI